MILKMVQKEAAFIFIKFQIALVEEVKIKELIELNMLLIVLLSTSTTSGSIGIKWVWPKSFITVD